jgi:tRNA(Ile)-lysidine synthase
MRMDPAVAAIRLAVRNDLADLEPGDLVLAAVSGGPDSLALAAALAAEAPRLTLRAGAVTIDHGLQEGSWQRAQAAAAGCERLGLAPVEIRAVTIDPSGADGMEALARRARYDAIDEVAAKLGAVAVLLGHTLDDQAETVLMRLGRGSGARSLAGMPARRGIYRRPLLGVQRAATLAACAELGLETWDDPHNANDAFTRVRVRRHALPALTEALGPGVSESLARSAELLRHDADALDGWAAAVPDDATVHELAGLPVAVRTRVLRRLAVAAGASAGALSADHVRDIDRLVTNWHCQGGVSLPGGLVAARAYDRLSFR